MNRDHNNIHHLFKNCAETPRADFEMQIIQCIHKRARRSFLIKQSILGLFTLISAVGIVPAVSHMLTQLSQTGFSQYASLVFSDTGAIWTSAKDFGLLLAESLPVMSIILVFGILLVMLWSIKKLIQKPLSVSSFAVARI